MKEKLFGLTIAADGELLGSVPGPRSWAGPQAMALIEGLIKLTSKASGP